MAQVGNPGWSILAPRRGRRSIARGAIPGAMNERSRYDLAPRERPCLSSTNDFCRPVRGLEPNRRQWWRPTAFAPGGRSPPLRAQRGHHPGIHPEPFFPKLLAPEVGVRPTVGARRGVVWVPRFQAFGNTPGGGSLLHARSKQSRQFSLDPREKARFDRFGVLRRGRASFG